MDSVAVQWALDPLAFNHLNITLRELEEKVARSVSQLHGLSAEWHLLAAEEWHLAAERQVDREFEVLRLEREAAHTPRAVPDMASPERVRELATA